MLGGFSGIGNDFQVTPDEASQYQLQFDSLPGKNHKYIFNFQSKTILKIQWSVAN